jgi:hypothetical protein
MDDILKVLKDTPIPTILIWAGLFFLLLAFVSKVGGLIEVQPNQKLPAIVIGLFLLTLGLSLTLMPPIIFNSPPTSQPTPQTPSPPTSSPSPEGDSAIPPPKPNGASAQNICATLLQKGSMLNWKVRNYGKLDNIGTLNIHYIDVVKGEWAGNQITETKGNVEVSVTGSFSNSTMVMLHPTEPEEWHGNCRDRRITGSIKTNYASELTFEMY